MQEFVFSFMDQFGYFGIFLLIAIENVFPPIPSELILTFGGFMTTYTSLNLPLMILFSTLGSVIGAIILYFIGKILNKERLIKIISSKPGKILRLKKSDIEKADEWFDKRGNKAVFFCRFVPLVRSLISIPAGMSEMPIFSFLLYTSIGTVIWNSILLFVGSKVGENWTEIVKILEQFSHVVVFLLAIAFVLVVVYFYYKKAHPKTKKKKQSN